MPPETHAGAEFACVGLYPGVEEEKEGRPLVGATGKELEWGLNAIGVTRRQVHWTNAIKCNPGADGLGKLHKQIIRLNREIDAETRERAEAGLPPLRETFLTPEQACRPWLEAETRPFRNILACGKEAAAAFLPHVGAISDIRGTLNEVPHPDGGLRKVLPTYNPAYVIYYGRWRPVFRGDLSRAVRWFRSSLSWEMPRRIVAPFADRLRAFLRRPNHQFTTCDIESLPAHYDSKGDPQFDPLTDEMRLIGFGDEAGDVGYQVPILPVEAANTWYTPDQLDEVLEVIADWLEDEGYAKVGHNFGYYDLIAIREWYARRRGRPCFIRGFIDTLLLHHCVESELYHGLGFVSSMLTDTIDWKAGDLATEAKTDEELQRYHCLLHDTPVVLADGSTRKIASIVAAREEVQVLSWDGTKIVPAKVIGWHRRVDAEQPPWLAIRTSMTKEGDRGLVVTAEHEVYTRRGKVRAEDLVPNDEIRSRDLLPDEAQRRAILGTLLGDSILVVSMPYRQNRYAARTAALQGGHAMRFGLAQAKARVLEGFLELKKPQTTYGYSANGCEAQPFLSPSCKWLKDLIPLFYDASGDRRLRREVLDALGDEGLAWWFMDDGFYQAGKDTICLALCRYSREDRQAAAAWFREKFGACSMDQRGILRFARRATDALAARISPFVFVDVRYKLPLELRPEACSGYEAWRPVELTGTFDRVLSVEPYEPVKNNATERSLARTRFCLTVEGTHCFFTPTGLVGNSIDLKNNALIFLPLWNDAQAKGMLAPLHPGFKSCVQIDHAMQRACVGMHTIGLPVDQEERGAWETKLLAKQDEWEAKALTAVAALGVDVRSFNTDRKKAEDVQRKRDEEAWEYEQRVARVADARALNLGSFEQVGRLLFDLWDLPLAENVQVDDLYREDGSRSTNDAVLRSYVGDPRLKPEQRNAVHALRLYRRQGKLFSTYVKPLRPLYDEPYCKLKRDGKIHADFKAHGTAVGRIAADGPNVLNIPAELRTMFVAPPGYALVGIDADALHLRIIASLWDIPSLKEAFIGTPRFHRGVRMGPHELFAELIFGAEFMDSPHGTWPSENGDEKWGKPAKSLRDTCKTTRYAGAYGAQVPTIYREITSAEDKDTGKLTFARMKMAQVEDIHDTWMTKEPQWERGWAREIETWNRQGYLADPIVGRRRNFGDRKETDVVNFRVLACVPGFSRITTQDGLLPIYQLMGRRFMAWTGKKWAPATAIYRGVQQLWRVKTRRTPDLYASADHHYLAVADTAYEWRAVQDLKSNGRIALDLARPLEFSRPAEPWEIEDAYWVGFWIADGHAAAKSNDVELAITISDGKKGGRGGSKEIASCLAWASARGLNATAAQKQSACTTVRMFKGAYAWMAAWGLDPEWRSHSKRVPEPIWRAALDVRRAFLRGVLQDGTFHEGRASLGLANQRLTEDLWLIFRSVGIDAALTGPYKNGPGAMLWRLVLPLDQLQVHLSWGEGSKRLRTSHEGSVPWWEARRLVDQLMPTCRSDQVIISRVRHQRGTTSPYLLARMGVENDVYDHAQVTFADARRVETGVYTLVVDDPEHRYVSDGVISKNCEAALMSHVTCDFVDAVPFEYAGPGTGLVLQNYDSLAAIVPEYDAERVAGIMRECITRTLPGFEVPFIGDPKIARWGDTKVGKDGSTVRLKPSLDRV